MNHKLPKQTKKKTAQASISLSAGMRDYQFYTEDEWIDGDP